MYLWLDSARNRTKVKDLPDKERLLYHKATGAGVLDKQSEYTYGKYRIVSMKVIDMQ